MKIEMKAIGLSALLLLGALASPALAASESVTPDRELGFRCEFSGTLGGKEGGTSVCAAYGKFDHPGHRTDRDDFLVVKCMNGSEWESIYRGDITVHGSPGMNPHDHPVDLVIAGKHGMPFIQLDNLNAHHRDHVNATLVYQDRGMEWRVSGVCKFRVCEDTDLASTRDVPHRHECGSRDQH